MADEPIKFPTQADRMGDQLGPRLEAILSRLDALEARCRSLEMMLAQLDRRTASISMMDLPLPRG